MALQELSLFHFTFLNNLYHPDVLNRWRTEGCYDSIAQRLGYRLVLVSSRFPSQAKVGSEIDFEITLRNDGFAAPVTEMVLRLVLQLGDSKLCSFEFNGSNTDPRFWFGNGTEYVVGGRIKIPSDMESGTWNVSLAIVDTAVTLSDIPQYNILAVNQDSSVQDSGLNNLSQSITISSAAEPGIETTTNSGVETVDTQFLSIIIFGITLLAIS